MEAEIKDGAFKDFNTSQETLQATPHEGPEVGIPAPTTCHLVPMHFDQNQPAFTLSEEGVLGIRL